MVNVLEWTGIATYCVLTMIGLFWLIDRTAEWFIDSARFKSYVWRYLQSRGEIGTKWNRPKLKD